MIVLSKVTLNLERLKMSNIEPKKSLDPKTVEQVLLKGNLADLTPEQKLSYYQSLCSSLSLNPLTKPFEYMSLNGKLVLYATKACAEQLRSRDGISIEDVKVECTEDFVRVTAKARNKEGRTDVALAVVNISGLKGEARANAEMKCDTKAKRRVTLSICGLGMLDETEVETIKDAKKVTAEDIMSGVAEPEIYTVPFGKFKDHTIEEIEEPKLVSYIKYLRELAIKQNKPIEGVVKEFIENAEAHLEGLQLDRQFGEITK